MVDNTTHIIGGIRHPRVTSEKHLLSLETFEIFKDDVIVVTSPKSGTTWMQEVISILKYDCDIEKADEEYIHIRFMFLDIPNYHKDMESPRVLKTHLPPKQIPREMLTKKPKIVFVSRNPKDTAVSFYNFHKSVSVLPSYDSWSDFLNDFCTGNVSRGDWFTMNSYWWNKRNEENVLFIKYEDMKKNLGDIVKKVASFLEWPIKDGKLPEILKHCSFEAMKDNEKVNYTTVPQIDTKKIPFMRKGEVGDWKNYFTVAQSEAFDKLYQEKMAGTGLEYEYEL